MPLWYPATMAVSITIEILGGEGSALGYQWLNLLKILVHWNFQLRHQLLNDLKFYKIASNSYTVVTDVWKNRRRFLCELKYLYLEVSWSSLCLFKLFHSLTRPNYPPFMNVKIFNCWEIGFVQVLFEMKKIVLWSTFQCLSISIIIILKKTKILNV